METGSSEEPKRASRPPPRVFLTEEDELDEILKKKLSNPSKAATLGSARRGAHATGGTRTLSPGAMRNAYPRSPTAQGMAGSAREDARRERSTDHEKPASVAKAGCCQASCCAPFLPCFCTTFLFAIVLTMWTFVYGFEGAAVCNQIALATFQSQLAKPGCGFHRRYNGRLVYISCPLYYHGVTDAGTGLHTVGYSMITRSMLLQHRVRYHYPKAARGATGNQQQALRQPPCICFEKVWSSEYIELPEDLEFSPRLCSRRWIFPGADCDPWYPGPNPKLDPLAPGTPRTALNSLGVYKALSNPVVMGKDGVELTQESLDNIGELSLPFRLHPCPEVTSCPAAPPVR